jgi:ammonia channel protein AmtB
MGTSLLAVAWAIFNSGLAMGIAIMVLMTIISGHTAHIIISTHAKHHSKIFLYLLLFFFWRIYSKYCCIR